MSDFDPRNLVGWLAVAVCLAFALVLGRTGERGSSARKLALLLVVEAVTLATSGAVAYGVNFREVFPPGEPWPSTWIVRNALHAAGDVGMLALYPPFLAASLATPLAVPFGNRRMRWLLGAAALGLFVAHFVALFWGSLALYASLCLLFAFAVVASLHAWRGARSELASQRARAFALGFGVRDLAWSVVYGSWAAAMFRAGPGFSPVDEIPTWFLIYPLGSLLSVPLIVYGILKKHLFDLDLRVKWTLQRSTLAAIFVAIVYLVSEAADRFFSAELGSVAGLLIAAGVVFFLAPLQRLAERIANAAMPNTQDTPAYVAFKKLQVYEAALAEVSGGGATERESAMLARLRETLGIAPADAEALERDLATRAAVVTDERSAP